jgi:serine/threonine-protein kinase
MEYLDGYPLNEMAKRWKEHTGYQGLMNREYINKVVRLTRQVVEALSALHEAGFIHGDPKPANIFVTSDQSRAVLMDPLIPAAVHEGQFSGTPAYTSLEQWEGRTDYRSDLYTIGVVLWELLAGQQRFHFASPHFASLSIIQLFEVVRLREPDPIRPHNPAVPQDLEAIVMQCLELDPNQRWPWTTSSRHWPCSASYTTGHAK